MTSLSINTVKHIAKLANLTLTDEEIVDFEKELSDTINYINQLNEVNTQGIPPTYQTGGQVNNFREDKTIPSLSQEDALKNANRTYNGFFVVKAIWD